MSVGQGSPQIGHKDNVGCMLSVSENWENNGPHI